ncbi:MAG: MBL fold metallo-hydrolase [Deltaproteobacteria bacterium]|nr:MBL fold metallo-hydrolase [Deltaproteobacteria bacterium]
MKVHFLGCGDAFGSGGRNQSAYLVETTDRLFLLDCGPTTLLSMKRAGIDPARLDVVVLSHLHGDHFGGLPFLFLEYLYATPRARPLRILGPPTTEKRVRALTQCMYPGISERGQSLPARFHVLKPNKQTSMAGITFFPFRVPHQVREISLGLKISHEGKTILYSGDSAWTDDFIVHADGADLFICECSFFARDSDSHLSYEKIKGYIPRLKCKSLVLTHMDDETLSKKLDPFVTSAQDGMVLEV